MSVRFLHTADWQLGKAFDNFGPDAGARLRDARLAAVRQIAQLANMHGVDAVLVAGDVFENQVVSPGTINGCLGAMLGFPGDWVLLPGNHDAATEPSVWDKVRLQLSSNAQIHLATTPSTIFLAQGRLAVLPAPLTRRHETADLTAAWDSAPTPGGVFRVGLAHGSVPGLLPEAADSQNPVSAERAATARLDYLALGDWHGRYKVSDRVWYAGTPEPDRFKDNHPGSVLLVTIEAPGSLPQVQPLPTGKYKWTKLERAIDSLGDWQDLDREIMTYKPVENQVVRLVLRGALPITDWQAAQKQIEWWHAQFAACDVEQEDLRAAVNGGDFAALLPPGYVAKAVAELEARALAGEADAVEALKILYQLCVEVGPGQ